MADSNENTEKTHYTKAELEEFKALILEKRAKAVEDLRLLKEAMVGNAEECNDTAPTFKSQEEGSNVLGKEENARLAARADRYIRDLDYALKRIENGTYGICRISGKLIPRERLLAVPHATTTVEAKNNEKKGKR